MSLPVTPQLAASAETKIPEVPRLERLVRSSQVDRTAKLVKLLALALFLLMTTSNEPIVFVAAAAPLTAAAITSTQTALLAGERMRFAVGKAPSRSLLSSLECTDGIESAYVDPTVPSTRSSGTVIGEHASVSVGSKTLVAYARDNGRIYINVDGTTRDFSGAPPASNSFKNPSVALSGNLLGIAYSDITGDTYFGITDTVGQVVKVPAKIFSESGPHTHPILIARSGGGWNLSYLGDDSVGLQSLNTAGDEIHSYSTWTSSSVYTPRRNTITELGDGNTLMLYEDAPNEISGRLLSPTLTLIDGSFMSLTGSFPVSQRLTSGNTLLVYLNSSGQPTWRTLSSGGATVVGDTLLCNLTPSAAATHLHLASASDGTVALSFTASDGDQNGVFVQLFNSDGTPREMDFLAYPSPAGDQNFGRTAFLSDGSARTAFNQGGSSIRESGFWPNNPPVPEPAGSIALYPGAQQTLSLNASDSDFWETSSPRLTAGLLEPWMEVKGAPGSYTFSAAPPTGSQGSYAAELIWEDDFGATAGDTISVEVKNQSPSVATGTQASFSVHIGETYSQSIGSFFNDDPDGDATIATLTRADGSALPSFISYDSGTKTMTVAPLPGDQGVVSLRARVEDGFGGSAEHTFAVEVPNRAPIVSAGAPTAIRVRIGERQTLQIASLFEELDQDQLSYSLERVGGPLVDPIAFDTLSGTITINARSGDQGVINLRARATDALGEERVHLFSVTVENQNPVWNNNCPIELNLTQGVRFTGILNSATDPDGDLVSYEGESLPSWMSLDSRDGSIEALPDPGSFEGVLRAKDSAGGVSSCSLIGRVTEVLSTSEVAKGQGDSATIGITVGILASIAGTLCRFRKFYNLYKSCCKKADQAPASTAAVRRASRSLQDSAAPTTDGSRTPSTEDVELQRPEGIPAPEAEEAPPPPPPPPEEA